MEKGLTRRKRLESEVSDIEIEIESERVSQVEIKVEIEIKVKAADRKIKAFFWSGYLWTY